MGATFIFVQIITGLILLIILIIVGSVAYEEYKRRINEN